MEKYIKTILKQIKNNILYVIWFILFFTASWIMLGQNTKSFIITTCIYLISISIALCPLGEEILKFINKIRKLETNKEKEYLIPIFQCVYEDSKNKYADMKNNIQLCIIDSMSINAVALGKHTIAVTQGAIQSLTEDELKGMIAHELGHIYNGDTIALLLMLVGNGIFSILVLICRISMFIFESVMEHISCGIFFIYAVKLVFYAIFVLPIYISGFIISINSRGDEYRADKFAYEIGYGTELISVLYLLQDITIPSNISFTERLRQSHPHLASRIKRLEEIDNI